MAISDPLTVAVGAANHEYSKTKTLPDGSIRMNIATDIATPENLVIKHQRTGKAGTPAGVVDRHLVQITKIERDPDTSQLLQASVNMTFVVPQNTVFTQADIEDLVAKLTSFLSTANITKVLRGES